MANYFQNLLGPIAPGVSPTVNPLSVLGAGMYSGDPANALLGMAARQQAGQQLAMQQRRNEQEMAMMQAEAERQRRQQEGMRATAEAMIPVITNPMTPLAPDVMAEQVNALGKLAQFAPESVINLGLAGMTPAAPPKTSDVSGMRKEFSRESDTWRQSRDAFDRMQAAQPTGPGDISLLTSYMKLLDPQSVVREGEFATASNAGGVPDRIRGMYNQLVRGKGQLTPELRAQFRSQAAALIEPQRQNQLRREQAYGGMVARAGMTQADVIQDYLGPYREGLPVAEMPTAPATPSVSLPPEIATPSQQEAIMRHLPERFRR